MWIHSPHVLTRPVGSSITWAEGVRESASADTARRQSLPQLRNHPKHQGEQGDFQVEYTEEEDVSIPPQGLI